jgi:annexin A7/11
VVDQEKARKEAEELHKAGEKRWGTDESKFNHILALRSIPQLRATFAEYRKISSYDIVRSIEHEMSGDLKNAFKALVMCIKDPSDYFAERLYKSMKGMGTNDEALTRLVVSRSELDLEDIKEVFFDKYNKSLAKMIKVRPGRQRGI